MHAHPRLRGVVAVLALVVTAVVVTASSSGGGAPPDQAQGVLGEGRSRPDVDKRKGHKAASAEQKQAVASEGLRAHWNRFGTPQSLAASDGALETGLAADEVQAARTYLKDNHELLGVSAATVDSLELLYAAPLGAGKAVLFRQRFGDLPAVHDGLVSLAVSNGTVHYVSSSLAENTLTGSAAIDAAAAIRAAAASLGLELGSLGNERTENGWTTFDAGGLTDPVRAQLGALPTPENGARTVWMVSLFDNSEGDVHGSTSHVDAATGELLVSEDTVDYASDNPSWKVFAASPPMDYSNTDTRELWCWTMTASVPGCEKVVSVPASPVPWDVDAETGTPTLQSRGNNERSTEKWLSNAGATQGVNFSSAPTRDFVYPWTNLWHEQRCNPAVFTPGGNEIDAARANLMAMHNRMHDWAYALGFTEQTFNAQVFNFGRGGAQNDPEHGNAQAGAVVGGVAAGFPSRDNANQNSPMDGISPTTNMYLWQPIPASFYSPCVDGDYDMSVIGHEYTHMISNRMVAGPNANLSGNQAGAMGESWSDLAAVEVLNSQGLVPLGDENPFAVGPYVTGDHVSGIRNYGMNNSPLNYSDVGYDFACNTTNQQGVCITFTQVHADGEIWSATHYDLRQAFIARYGAGTPDLQASCFSGATPTASCPGNRRWIQLVFDAWLLMASGAVDMLDARDAMLAADTTRFGGANQDLLWNVFARRGMGSGASTTGSADFEPTPSFESPFADEAEVTFVPAGDASGAPVRLYVGDYEARATPIADTDPATPLGATFRIVPGEYDFVAVGAGLGHKRFTFSFNAGQVRDLPVNMPRNLASAASGATASGDGVNLDKLTDDTELTNWASLSGPVAGKQVTVRLGSSQQVRRVEVSAMLRQNIGDANDPGGQNRFTALRQFEIWTCEAKGAVDCSSASQFSRIFTSPADAFPSLVPRPRAPELIIRSFDVPQTKATHVRLVVLNNQCTGGPAYQGDLDDDPLNSTDCDTTTVAGLTGNGERVRVAELQVFSH